MVTNRFNQLFYDQSDPFKLLKAAENKKKEAGRGGIGGSGAERRAQATAPDQLLHGGVPEGLQEPTATQRQCGGQERGGAGARGAEERRNKTYWKKT